MVLFDFALLDFQDATADQNQAESLNSKAQGSALTVITNDRKQAEAW